MILEIKQNAFGVSRFVESINKADVVASDLRRKEAQLGEKKRELEEYIENLANAQKLDGEIEESRKKMRRLDHLLADIHELMNQYEHEAFGAVDRFNEKINNIYHVIGFTTFKKIEIVKEMTRDRLTSLDVIVTHKSVRSSQCPISIR